MLIFLSLVVVRVQLNRWVSWKDCYSELIRVVWYKLDHMAIGLFCCRLDDNPIIDHLDM